MHVRCSAHLSQSDAVRMLKAALCLTLTFSLLATAAVPIIAPADPNRYLDDIKVLAAPDMEGRGPGTKGLARASQYLEQRYKTLGLQPAGTDGYRQPFTVTTGAKLKSDNETDRRRRREEDSRSQINQDFVPISFSSSGSLTAPLVFVGYGATADEFQYDDYAGIDVKDKIVVVLRYEPDGFRGEERTPGPDAALAAHHQGDQRAQSRREGGDPGQRKAGRRRGRFADALRQRERAGKCRHRDGAGEECCRRELVSGGREVAGRRAAADQSALASRSRSPFRERCSLPLKIDIEATHAR